MPTAQRVTILLVQGERNIAMVERSRHLRSLLGPEVYDTLDHHPSAKPRLSTARMRNVEIWSQHHLQDDPINAREAYAAHTTTRHAKHSFCVLTGNALQPPRRCELLRHCRLV
jgi:hypothetical protein